MLVQRLNAASTQPASRLLNRNEEAVADVGEGARGSHQDRQKQRTGRLMVAPAMLTMVTGKDFVMQPSCKRLHRTGWIRCKV
jgi:hypothetical protein